MDIDVEKIKDNVKENFDKAAEYTIKKTNEIVAITKLKIKKTDIKGKIKDKYKEIGKLVYISYKDDEDISDKVRLLISDIDQLNADLEECLVAIEKLKEE